MVAIDFLAKFAKSYGWRPPEHSNLMHGFDAIWAGLALVLLLFAYFNKWEF